MTVSLHCYKYDNLTGLPDDDPVLLSLRDIAENIDLLITWYGSPSGIDGNWAQIVKLKNWNPQMKIFIYRNATCIYDYSEDFQHALDNNWVLREYYPNGPIVTKDIWTNNVVLDIGNPDVRAYIAGECAEYCSHAGVDGIFGDVSQCRIGSVSAYPNDPRTNQPFDYVFWRTSMAQLISEIRAATGKPYISNGNGLSCGSTGNGYYKYPKCGTPILNVVDGVAPEGCIRWRTTAEWRSDEDWELDAAFLQMLNGMGKITLAWMLVKNNEVPNVPAPPDQIAMFGFCTYLLALSGESYFIARDYEEEFMPISKMDVGEPVGLAFERGDSPIWQRNFTMVKVLVNPTDTAYTIQVEGEASSRTVQPHTGVILDIESEPTPTFPFGKIVAALSSIGFIGILWDSSKRRG